MNNKDTSVANFLHKQIRRNYLANKKTSVMRFIHEQSERKKFANFYPTFFIYNFTKRASRA